MNMQVFDQNRMFLEKVSLLNPLTSAQKDTLAAALISQKYFTGQKIITEGETGNQLFFVKEGVVSVMKGSQEVTRFTSGDYFGEAALITNNPRTATCIAVDGPVKCMCLTREILQKALNNKLENIIEKNTIAEAFKKSSKLSLLTKDQKEALLRSLTEKHYNAGDIVIAINTMKASKIYIVLSGRLQYAKNAALFCDKGTLVGDIYVTAATSEDSKYEDDLIAGCDMKVAEISKFGFEKAIGGTFENVIKENSATNILRKIFLFSSIDHTSTKDLLSLIIIKKFNDSEIVLREGVFSH